MNRILLFDIDGTLMRIERAFMHRLLKDLMTDLSLDHGQLEKTPFAGRTDRAIFRSLLGSRQEDATLYARIKSGYIHHMEQKLETRHLQILEAVKECLEYLSSARYSMGLLTGNFREVAHMKLSLAKLDSYFTFGAFGCNHTDRNLLGKEAMDSYAGQFGSRSKPERYILIGDTPHDIRCARHMGAGCVAVTTGHFTREELAEHRPDIILDSLSNPQDWLSEF